MDRPRLVARLSAHRSFIAAGAGAGKSALLAQAAARTPNGRVIRLTPGHGTPTALAAELEAVRRSAVEAVFLDDAHWCGGEAAGVLERYLVDAPQRIVVASREPLPFATMRAEFAPLTLLGVRDLAIRLDEVAGVFASVGAPAPTLGCASALLAETAGWPTLVGLIADAVSDAGPDRIESAIASVIDSGFSAPIEAALADLDPALRHALASASMLPVVRAATVTDLIGSASAARLLAALDDGVIVHRLRPDGGRELPRLLRRHLLALLGRAERGRLAFAARGAVPDVLHALAEAGSAEALAVRLRTDPMTLARPGSAAWAAELPAGWDADLADVTAARALADDRSLAAARARLAQAAAAHPPAPIAAVGDAIRAELDATDPASGGSGPSPTGVTARVRAALRLLLAGDAVGTVRRLRRCLREADVAADTRLAVHLALIVACSATARPGETSAALCQVEADASSLGLTGLARLARGILAALGDVPRPTSLREAVDECEARGDDEGAALIESAWLLACLRSGRAEPSRARALAGRYASLGWPGAAAIAACTAAYLAAVAREPGATATIAAAEAASLEAPSPAAHAWLDAARAVLDPERSEALLASSRRAAWEAGMPRLPVTLPAARPLVGRRAASRDDQSNRTDELSWTDRSNRTDRSDPPDRPDRADRAAGSDLRAAERIPTVAIGCFGGFRITIDGRDLDLHGVRPQARSVLRMLALNAGAPVHRELISELIWGELGTTSAMHTLHVSISSLRRALGTDTADHIVERDGEAYRLRLAHPRDCDLTDFDASLDGASDARRKGDPVGTANGLRHAVGRYAGEVLPEDGPAEWAVGARERYRTRASEAAAALAHLELRFGDRQGALEAATRAVEIDPWLDESWRALLTVHRHSGDVVASRRTEQGYRRMRAALGVE